MSDPFPLRQRSTFEHFVSTQVSQGAFTSLVASIGGPRRGREPELIAASGASVNPDSVFDLASLSKPFLSTLALSLAAKGELDLDEPVFPRHFDSMLLPAPTLEALLRHQGGAIAWWPLYFRESGPSSKNAVNERLGDESQESQETAIPGDEAGGDAPPFCGTTGQLLDSRLWGRQRSCYSDIGFLTACRWIEERLATPVTDLLASFRAELLPESAERGLPCLGAEVDERLLVRCALDTDKEVDLAFELGKPVLPLGPPSTGLPQDGNARYLMENDDLLPGHAGLFGDARCVIELGRLWLSEMKSETPLGKAMNVALTPKEKFRSDRILGWFLSEPGAVAENGSVTKFHHTGFVGGGLWIDLQAESVSVMLGYRADPLANIGQSRTAFIDLTRDLLSSLG